MKKTIASCMLIILVAAGCNYEKKQEPVLADETNLSSLLFCTELPSPISENDGSSNSNKRLGAVRKDKLWRNDPRFPLGLTVRFLNGTDFQKNKVMQYAKTWNEVSAKGFNKESKIQLRFIPVDGTTSGNVADIRILFRPGGSSSNIGTDAKSVPQDQATMFFGWIDEVHSEADIRRAVLHEFGHALGMVHEHQSPVAKIPWDREKVYEYYERTQDPPWTREMVDRNIFDHYSEESTNHTAYDPTSIMQYDVPEELTVGNFQIPFNSVLSPTDEAFINKVYKYRPCIINETCCYDRRTGKEIKCP